MAQYLKTKYVYGLIAILIGALLLWRVSKRSEGKINSVRTPAKVIALTFDDGPHPIYTRQILDTLHKYKVKATFFMIGVNIRKYPEIVRQVVAGGHALGNHTDTHPRNLATRSVTKINKELRDCQATIRQVTGLRVFIFRPPRGKYDQKVIEVARHNGYQTILWSVCGDRRSPKTPRLMAQHVLQRIQPGDIILLHDGDLRSRWKDAAATQFIVEGLLRKGFRFKTIPQLLKFSKSNARLKKLILGSL
jgi:peptidoglycan/xylan/chitin deacetylase (PgdA/CDA1 family)